MITPEFVRIPLRVKAIVNYGIGSVKIDKQGNIEILVVGNDAMGQLWQEAFRKGELDSLQIVPVSKKNASATG